ncbi:MAG: hypothetical protein CL476_00950 [Acidobacteria bacterium]|nr:hypothetical protein [Acidobacteriota bacterium]
MSADPLWVEHYRDERDAAFLYRALAAVEVDDVRRDLFERLASVEDRHVEKWEALFAEHEQPTPSHRLSCRTRLLAWVARRFGTATVLPMILAEEGREVTAYLRLAQGSDIAPVHDAAFQIATESAEHARELSSLLGREGEPWHAGGGGGYLRSVVYGFNDGLTANLGLVAGVIGASVGPQVVVITGIAGAIADALSMGSSGYLAAKSEAEVHAHQIEMERLELELMPDVEEEELALIYEAKGMTADRAKETASTLMRDPAQALEAKVREELQLRQADLSPAIDGWVTGSATAVGALIPIVPFLLLEVGMALWVSLVASMAAHFAIGGARSIFTGRSVWVSGRDMFLVGFGVAAVGYLIGEAIARVW